VSRRVHSASLIAPQAARPLRCVTGTSQSRDRQGTAARARRPTPASLRWQSVWRCTLRLVPATAHIAWRGPRAPNEAASDCPAWRTRLALRLRCSCVRVWACAWPMRQHGQTATATMPDSAVSVRFTPLRGAAANENLRWLADSHAGACRVRCEQGGTATPLCSTSLRSADGMKARPGATMLARPSLRVWAPGLAHPYQTQGQLCVVSPHDRHPLSQDPRSRVPAASRLPRLPIRRPDSQNITGPCVQ
jgi:hypothetical protein